MRRQHVRRALSAIFTSATLCVFWGCGSPNPQSTPAGASRPQATEVPDIASADPKVSYFHEQLVANGEDVQTEFGTFLSTLGMNPRDLQQDDPQHAYDTVMEKVRELPDAALRRSMLQTFFNVSEQ